MAKARETPVEEPVVEETELLEEPAVERDEAEQLKVDEINERFKSYEDAVYGRPAETA